MNPSPLLQGPILRTLLKLAVPNVFAMVAATAVGIGETLYVGLLGKVPLAAMALVFPLVMLMQMFSAGSMGGFSIIPPTDRPLTCHSV